TDADGNGIDFKSVNVSGSVDPTKPGEYEVTYSYTDAGGNQVSAKATITVVSTKASIKAKDSTLVAGPDTGPCFKTGWSVFQDGGPCFKTGWSVFQDGSFSSAY
uniref:immunoglobulin-like domain-containing protein n=1 Tax=Lacticaseibacillus paracasei TaxID=1597 RepID=UPI0023611D26